MTFKLNFLKEAQATQTREKKKFSFPGLIFYFLGILLLTYLLYIPPSKTVVDPDIKVGDIAKKDIIVTKDITIEDKEGSEENRKLAIDNITPVYEYDPDTSAKSQELLNRWFTLIRSARKDYIKGKINLTGIKKNIAAEFGLDFTDKELKNILQTDFFIRVDLDQLLVFVKSLYDKKILPTLTGARRSKDGTVKLISKGSEPEILKLDEFYDLKKVEMALDQFLEEQQLIAPKPAAFIASILKDFIEPNISFSNNLTKEEEQQAAIAANPAVIKLKADKIIIRKGDEIKPEDLKILKLIAYTEERRDHKVSNFYLILVMLSLLTFFGSKFFKVWQSGGLNTEKTFLVMGATLIVSAVAYRIVLFLLPIIVRNLAVEVNYDMESIFFAIPFGFGALAMAFIFNLHSAVIFSFINAIIGGIICQWDFKIALYILIGNLAVSFAIEYYQRLKRSPIIKAAILWLLPLNALMILVFNVTKPDIALPRLSVDLLMGCFSAIFAAFLAAFIIPLWETLFKLVTDLKLIELTNLNLPIFREMLEKAPGSYHHSQMVASLAEAAALDLNLSPLLLTAMALYHDLGKIHNPHFFTENHTVYKNPHDNLTPRESSKNIIAHIPDGLEQAEKLKLPSVVSASILQHHGTKVVRFFYDKAREMSTVESDGFDDKGFRYEGIKPKNVENAIIMLADQVEAASKSLASPSDEEIKNVIRRIINVNMDENQFDECEGLTFKALNIIANSFHRKLSSIYHMRVSYPGFDFKDTDKEEK
ncbi:MAG TPA: HD domain-containing protein, partial [Candidatus Kapabacteria bacterium]|nr:HD domain-containing protein [Candidatus Kapabacteria bacterium]